MNASTPIDMLRAAEADATAGNADVQFVVIAEPGDEQATESASELVDRAEISGGQSLVKLSKSEAQLAQLRTELAGIDLALIETDTTVEDVARKFRVKASASITAFKENCLDLRRPARDFATLVIKAEEVIETKMREVLATVSDPLKKIDDERKAERERKATEAAAALQKITDAVNAIRSRPNLMMGKPSTEVAEALSVIEAIDITEEEFGKQAGDAMIAKFETIETLKSMLGNALRLEAQQRVLAEQQEKLTKANDAQNALNAIAGMAMQALGKPAATIAELITELEAVDVMADVFGDRAAEALAARTHALASLSQLHAAAVNAEGVAAQQKQQQDELDAKAREQQARQEALDKAEQDRKDAEARADRESSQRAADIQARIDRMSQTPDRLEATEATASAIESELRTLNDTLVTIADFGDRQAEADKVKASTLGALSLLHAAAEQREETEAAAAREAQTQREREAAAEALADKVREVAGVLLEILRDWSAADGLKGAKKTAALAAAAGRRDALLQSLKG